MKTNINWTIHRKIVYANFPAEFDIHEWNDAGSQIRYFFDQGDSPVHVIVDMLGTKSHPMNAIEIIRGASPWLQHPRLGWTLHLTDSKVIRLLATITVQRYVARYRAFLSAEEAMHFIQEIDSSL